MLLSIERLRNEEGASQPLPALAKLKSMSETTIRLTVDLERFLSAQVKQGIHRSPEAAILAVLERERRRTEQLVWLKREVQNGVDALDEGRLVPFDAEGIKHRGRARLAARKKQSRG